MIVNMIRVVCSGSGGSSSSSSSSSRSGDTARLPQQETGQLEAFQARALPGELVERAVGQVLVHAVGQVKRSEIMSASVHQCVEKVVGLGDGARPPAGQRDTLQEGMEQWMRTRTRTRTMWNLHDRVPVDHHLRRRPQVDGGQPKHPLQR